MINEKKVEQVRENLFGTCTKNLEACGAREKRLISSPLK